MRAWRGWHHCVCSTYGTWVPGDERGFRTRQHREHVDGDYKQPPPAGVYAARHAHAGRLMSRPPVVLSIPLRQEVLELVYKSLQRYGVEVIAICVGARHMHVEARFPERIGATPAVNAPDRSSAVDNPARHLMGKAKQWSSKALIRGGKAESGIWAKRGKFVAIRDRAHQLKVFHYIRNHIRENAVVWTVTDGLMLPSHREKA